MSSPPTPPNALNFDKPVLICVETKNRAIAHPWYQYPSDDVYVLCKLWNGRIVKGYFDKLEREWKNSLGDRIIITEWI